MAVVEEQIVKPYHQTDRFSLHVGDCREVLKSLADNSVDSIVTDPPYELTANKRGGTGAASLNLNSPAGRSRVTTGFMGQRWDGTGAPFDVDTWIECLRVLKPGGHLLAFGGSRTYHRLACAIEDAGFEIRDQIQWLYGSGFPKSLDISKAIDALSPRVGMFGAFARHYAERRFICGLTHAAICEAGKFFDNHNHGGASVNWERGYNVPTLEQWTVLHPLLGLSPEWLPLIERIESEREVIGIREARAFQFAPGAAATPGAISLETTAPATDAAKQWNGWGTALKPACEDWWLCRKPLEGTVAQNVLRHGTGGLNIAACRVTPYDQRPDAGACTPRSQNGVLVDTSASVPSLLQNECRRIAFALRSCSTGDTGPWRGEGGRDGKLLADVEYESLRARLYPNGVWCGLTLTSVQDSPACCPSCRRSCDALFHRVQERARESAASLADVLVDTCREIPALVHNRECQSTARPSSCDVVPLFAAFLSRLSGSIIPDIQPSRVIDFGGDWYRSEQNPLGRWPSNIIHDGSEEVLAGFPADAGANGGNGQFEQHSWMRDSLPQSIERSKGSAARFFYCAKSSQEDRNEGLEDLPHRVADEVHKRPRTELDDPRRHGVTPRQNYHPTVKPTDLMRYLCRLITPPSGVVLDPFCGSGSTGKAAMLEGFKFVGIELNADYLQLAQLRIEAVTRQGLLFA